MAYKVLAIKCRPQTFDEVIGQKHVTQTLKNAIKEKRIAHAFLFIGERGVGKTSIARILAKALNCNEGPTEQPCNKCPSCIEITDSASIDVHEIDGASNNGVEAIRTLRENVKYLPTRDKHKIYIIDEVHMLSTSAFNALLKTLEEPPDHIIFIFATTEPQKIPDTIISRCLRFDLKRISSNEIINHLLNITRKENISISSKGLSLIAREADGSMRDSQTILERAISYCGSNIEDSTLEELLGHIDSQFIYRIMGAVISDDSQACMDTVNEIYEYGVDFKKFYYAMLEHIRDLIMVKTLKDPKKSLNHTDEDIKRLQDLVAGISTDALHRCFRMWFSSEGEITRSALPKIALEVALLEMMHIKKALPIDDLISKIDKLQNQAGIPAKNVYTPGTAREIQPKASQKSSDYQSSSKKENNPASNNSTNKDAEAFLNYVRQKHVQTFSILQHGNLYLNNSEFIIEMPAGSFQLDMLKDPEKENKIKELCDAFFNKDIKLTIRATDQIKKPDNQKKSKDLKQKAKDEIFHNPVIQKVVETFSGSRILEIKTDL